MRGHGGMERILAFPQTLPKQLSVRIRPAVFLVCVSGCHSFNEVRERAVDGVFELWRRQCLMFGAEHTAAS